ncbi:MAG: hypothetical protein ABW321_20280 [Polyangiales bacterium]
MSKYIVLRDRRVKVGGVPARPGLTIINTSETEPLSRAFSAIRAATRRGPAKALFIVCHGAGRTSHDDKISIEGGGSGLQLGADCVFNSNVVRWTAIAGAVEEIVVYACRAAVTLPGREGTGSDGKYMMGALALHTKATVYAADQIQIYHPAGGTEHGRFKMGAWEGQVWEFPPSGAGPSHARAMPKSIDSVFKGH